MEQVQIKNDNLIVTINLRGAEVRSVRNGTSGHEYMWCADPAIWSGVSPTLFPVVGKTSNGIIKFAGKEYPQGNHGFARSSMFKLIESSAQTVSLQIITSELGDVYPFNLAFTVSYSLEGNKLTTKYQVKNLDSQTAYFSVGAHPAFACPFDKQHKINDYVIEFEQNEPNLQRHGITPQAFFTGKVESESWQTLQLTPETLGDNTLVYANYQSKSVCLREANSTRQIKVTLDGFPLLGLWSKIGGDYVCIEPWCGHSDLEGFTGNINDKAHIEIVNTNETWKRSYSIEFSY